MSTDHGYFTFWEKIFKDEEYTYINLYTGEKGAYFSSDNDYNLEYHRALPIDKSVFLQGRDFINDDLGSVIPVSVIYLLEPTEEELTEKVEVEDTILIAVADIAEDDIVVS